MAVELTVERNKLESFLPLLGAEVDADGYIVDAETGEVKLSPDGEALTIDEVGYLGHHDEKGVEPVRDNLPSIVSYLDSLCETEGSK